MNHNLSISQPCKLRLQVLWWKPSCYCTSISTTVQDLFSKWKPPSHRHRRFTATETSTQCCLFVSFVFPTSFSLMSWFLSFLFISMFLCRLFHQLISFRKVTFLLTRFVKKCSTLFNIHGKSRKWSSIKKTSFSPSFHWGTNYYDDPETGEWRRDVCVSHKKKKKTFFGSKKYRDYLPSACFSCS